MVSKFTTAKIISKGWVEKNQIRSFDVTFQTRKILDDK